MNCVAIYLNCDYWGREQNTIYGVPLRVKYGEEKRSSFLEKRWELENPIK